MNKNILVIEDNDYNIRLYEKLLMFDGYDIVIARDGKEAINIFENNTPDLIIMDIQLPDISGIDLIKQIRTLEHLNNTPILAVSAFMSDVEDEVKIAGCDGYMAKPINITNFSQAIKTLL